MSSWSSFFKRPSSGGGDYWLTVSDLMAALMVIFLFISIAFMLRVMKVVVAWDETQEVIFEELVHQFQDNLEEWNAEFEKERLIIRFKDPETLFQRGEAILQPAFKEILSEFCPKYFAIVDGVMTEIDEVRIEGHTSPEWNAGTPERTAFFNNMRLSQSRTRAVMEYCLSLPESGDFDWLTTYTRAVGMSSSSLMFEDDGTIDYEGSRRVEFRIKTKAEERISSILGEWQ